MSNQATGYPRFEPDAELVVDAHNGHEVWTGARWNEFVESAERNQNIVTVRITECPPHIERGPLSAEEADDQDYEREYLQYRREQDADGGAAWQGLRYE